MPNPKLTGLLSALLITAAVPAQAYIDPGAGAGAIAVVLGVLASIFVAFFAILWNPVKRLMKKRKAAKQTVASDNTQDSDPL